MRHQKTRLQPQRSPFRQWERINQKRGIDFMDLAIPAGSDVQAIAEDPEDGAVDEVECEGDPAEVLVEAVFEEGF